MSLIKLRKKLQPFTVVKHLSLVLENNTVLFFQADSIKCTITESKKAIITALTNGNREGRVINEVKAAYEVLELEAGTYKAKERIHFLNEDKSMYLEQGDEFLIDEEFISTSYGKFLEKPRYVCKSFKLSDVDKV